MRTIIKSAVVVFCALMWLLLKEASALAESLPSEVDMEFAWPEFITVLALFMSGWLILGLAMAVLQN